MVGHQDSRSLACILPPASREVALIKVYGNNIILPEFLSPGSLLANNLLEQTQEALFGRRWSGSEDSAGQGWWGLFAILRMVVWPVLLLSDGDYVYDDYER